MTDLETISAYAEERIREAELAMPGPWAVEVDNDGGWTGILSPINGNATWPARALSGNFGEVVGWDHGMIESSAADVHNDATFIASARESVPTLARHVLELVERVRELEGK